MICDLGCTIASLVLYKFMFETLRERWAAPWRLPLLPSAQRSPHCRRTTAPTPGPTAPPPKKNAVIFTSVDWAHTALCICGQTLSSRHTTWDMGHGAWAVKVGPLPREELVGWVVHDTNGHIITIKQRCYCSNFVYVPTMHVPRVEICVTFRIPHFQL